MTNHDTSPPAHAAGNGSIELILRPKLQDLGELSVRRVLPSAKRKMVGPFIFFDHMGPAEFAPGEGISVRPHPHIGLATITYLFDGQIMHRDSLGYEQPIEAGAVNLMTAGRGIVHSERAGDDLDTHSTLHGIQSWMALPNDAEETEPEFIHYPAASIPEIEMDGVVVRVIMGSAFGAHSNVKTYSPTLYLECQFSGAGEIELPVDCEELAFYVVEGSVQVGDERYDEGAMAVARPGQTIGLRSTAPARVMVIGGSAVGTRYLWWNFVSSSRRRIETAKADWEAMRFGRVQGDDEFIPLPQS